MVTRCAATRNAPVDRCAEVDRSEEAGRYAVADRGVVVGRCAAAALHIVAFHDVVLVEIRVALNVARSAVPNAVPNVVRRFWWDDFRSAALAVAPVQVAAQVVFPETMRASQVVRCAAHSAAEDCCAAGFRSPVGRAAVSQLLPASTVAREPAAPEFLQAVLMQPEFGVD